MMTASATLAVLVGGMLLLAGTLRFGFIANFISAPVLTGFKSGIGLVIVVDQIPKLLGIHIAKGTFGQNVLHIAASLSHTAIPTLLLAVGLIALRFALVACTS